MLRPLTKTVCTPTSMTQRVARNVILRFTAWNPISGGSAANAATYGRGAHMSELAFDKHQFARCPFAVSAMPTRDGWDSTGISHADYKGMHQFHRKGFQLSVPPFALNGKKLAEVLKLVAWRYVHGGGQLPEGITLEELKRKATNKFAATIKQYQREHLPEYQKQLGEQHAAAVEKAGGYLQLYATLAWMSWRSGMNSVQVAKETGISPVNVRANLQRMRDIGRQLFPEDCPPKSSHAIKAGSASREIYQRNGGNKVMHLVAEKIKAGKSIKNVMDELACTERAVREHKKKWEATSGKKLSAASPRTLQRRAWIAQGLCGVDGKDPVKAGRAECERHALYYRNKQREANARKKARNSTKESQENLNVTGNDSETPYPAEEARSAQEEQRRAPEPAFA